MRRKATNNTRIANQVEFRLMAWVKEQPCIICGASSPSIVDHMYGSTFKHRRILIGMIALLPYCEEHDQVKTLGGRKAHNATFGNTQAQLFEQFIETYPNRHEIPDEVVAAIIHWGR